jgi:ribose transport system substrate-binding protein
MKKALCILLALFMVLAFVAACGDDDDGRMYIPVISKGFQHQFWQTVNAGSQQAAEDFDVDIFFVGPESEADIAIQVGMIDTELAKNPSAIALAALSTEAVLSQLQDAYDRGIPIVGFDSGVPDAPAGQIAATASTDNEAAAALAAEHMFPEIQAAVAAATADNPVTIGVLSQDVVSASVGGRTKGFAERMYTLASGANGSVAIVGGFSAINKGDANPAVRIDVVVGATPTQPDMDIAGTAILNIENLLGVFMSNEGAVNGILNATSAGSVIPAGCILIGFDAGSAQKGAVRNGTFFGSITQDPFMIGYLAVELAVRAARGEPVSDRDTGAKWWDASNMDQPEIARLLYD